MWTHVYVYSIWCWTQGLAHAGQVLYPEDFLTPGHLYHLEVASLNQFIKSSSTNFISALQNPVPSVWQFEISCGRSIYHRHWQKIYKSGRSRPSYLPAYHCLYLRSFYLILSRQFYKQCCSDRCREHISVHYRIPPPGWVLGVGLSARERLI